VEELGGLQRALAVAREHVKIVRPRRLFYEVLSNSFGICVRGVEKG
jgi:hypothetical protein